jgi:hypothetical protein
LIVFFTFVFGRTLSLPSNPIDWRLRVDTVDKLGMAWFFGVGFWQQRSFIFRPGLIAGAVVCFWSVDFRFGIAIRPVSGQAVVAWP